MGCHVETDKGYDLGVVTAYDGTGSADVMVLKQSERPGYRGTASSVFDGQVIMSISEKKFTLIGILAIIRLTVQ